ncbi:mitochondrial import inner membrane translocase subunit Tim29 [Manduca sexta]|uniref:mitochondrial import inner membrane translocase subunit Tim29 n=1 Tax=Manduca sexta TaxID=7130 RepID=UPI001184585C|nr:mitochondrial import inner membrane translocase subunit Tim29 [Manduca sexta]
MLRIFRKAPSAFENIQAKIKFPEKFKGTILEKWADYWKNLFIDYRQMLQDLRSDVQDEPIKALKWTAGIITATALAKNNPTETDFKDSLKRISNEVALVNEDCLNPKSVGHIRYLAMCYNEEVLHYKNFGLVSVMYVKDLNDSCDLYKAHCSYMQPTYLSLPSKIVDVGFMGKWWNLYIKTTNYDVNV